MSTRERIIMESKSSPTDSLSLESVPVELLPEVLQIGDFSENNNNIKYKSYNRENRIVGKRKKLDEEDRGARAGAEAFRAIYFKKQKEMNKGHLPYLGVSTPYEGTDPHLQKYYEPYADSDEEERKLSTKKSKKKCYTFQFKMAVIKEAFRTTPFRAAEKYGLTRAQVAQWRKKYIAEGPQAFMIKGKGRGEHT